MPVTAVSNQDAAAPDPDSELAPPNVDLNNLSRQPSARSQRPADEPFGNCTSTRDINSDAADRATLLRKFTVHPTSSRRLQGLADAGLMLLALLPTVLLRLIRTAMGLLGITEHRWRGISMVVPLTLDDRAQLQITAHNLVAGRLGRRPEPPARGPIPPALQLLLDTHAILAAAASTSAAFSLPYSGLPEAALQSKLASFLRDVAAADSVCPQDCLKAMRKMARKALTTLCSSAPRLPTSPAPSSSPPSSAASIVLPTLRPSPSAASSTGFISKPKKRTVAKAFMAACLLEQGRSQPDTLIQLVARLPDGSGDLVESVSLLPLAPGAEYLRLLDAAAGEPGRFADQLEAAAEFGRLRPSDAKKEHAMQGLAINARVHGVGVVRYAAMKGAAGATSASGGAVPAAAALPSSSGNSPGGESSNKVVSERPMSRQNRRELQQRQGQEAEGAEAKRCDGEAAAVGGGGGGGSWGVWGDGLRGGGPAAAAAAGGAAAVATSNGGVAPNASRGPSESGSVGSEGDDTMELLRWTRKNNGATSSQPDLADPKLITVAATANGAITTTTATTATGPKSGAGLLAAAASSLRKIAAEASSAATTANGGGEAAAANGHNHLNGYTTNGGRLHRSQHQRAKPSSFTAASGPSTSIHLYPTAALDVLHAIYACPRSGAFAVHGRRPHGVGLSRLAAAYAGCHLLPAAEQRALLRRLGFDSLEGLGREVELRRALCVAQALPVLIASLRLMVGSAASSPWAASASASAATASPSATAAAAACLRSASRTGSFLHVQQSLLSDLHGGERGYLEDMRGALEVLGERLVVRFVEGSEKVLPLQLSGASITVSLPADCVSEAALAAAGLSRGAFCSATYGVTPLLFNTGINSLQSLGFLLAWGKPSGGEPLQDMINRHSLERLNEFASRAGAAGGLHLAALNRHYSSEGRRAAKDTAMFSLVRRAVAEVGGGRAVNCKSGKDRTALELSKALAEEVVGAGLMPAEQLGWLEGQFLRGLSYVTTSQNHGQPPAYAFNEMEIATLPPGWRPDWRLCGKVSS